MDINIDTGKAFLVIGLTILGVILVNVAIYYSVRGRGTIQQIEFLRKAVGQTRNPWELEDTALKELSEMVSQLKEKPNGTAQEDESAENQEGPQG